MRHERSPLTIVRRHGSFRACVASTAQSDFDPKVGAHRCIGDAGHRAAGSLTRQLIQPHPSARNLCTVCLHATSAPCGVQQKFRVRASRVRGSRREISAVVVVFRAAPSDVRRVTTVRNSARACARCLCGTPRSADRLAEPRTARSRHSCAAGSQVGATRRRTARRGRQRSSWLRSVRAARQRDG